ncbi:hypothetical protein HYALB_00001469 [Hymenoscyphus albidus]|uniref:NAD(P)-binding protein n=1 Tax=Hymenoscyphus albidus TaxID=595503 RepID=A0A9N9LER7_9HELO|nr:hypothetical protein HYALB_00001469 [Hymenoscyphus albidus]
MGVSTAKYEEAHKGAKGPGDHRPTAEQIILDDDLVGKLKGKTMLVTGTSAGIGVETVRVLATTGATIFCAVRNLPKAEKALAGILEPGRVELLEMDMASLASVRKGAAEFRERNAKLGGKLNVLITNAGLMMLQQKELTVDGFEAQFGVCHVAHFLLFNLVKELLIASATPEFQSRVVVVSSMAHQVGPVYPEDNYSFTKIPYQTGLAYGQAKRANVHFANEITRRYGSKGVFANSLMPGTIDTMSAPGVELPQEVQDFFNAYKLLMKDVPQGAATTVLAAVGKEWNGVGGKYLEDCREIEVMGKAKNEAFGYHPDAFDEVIEKRLWDDSLRLVGLPQDA